MPLVDNSVCKSKVSDLQASQLEFATMWIASREFARAHGPTIETVDKKYADLWAQGDHADIADFMSKLDPAEKAFLDAFANMLQAMTPAQASFFGWDNSSCRMNWIRYACVCAYFAKIDAAALAAAAAAIVSGNAPQFSCDPVVLSDLTYDCEWPMPNQKCTDASWKDWILPVGVVVVGGGLLWLLWSGAGAKLNPTSSASKLVWHQHAGGTGAKEGKYGYTAVGDFGEYHIEAPQVRSWGYKLMWANTKGMNAPHGGLWHDLGKFPSPAGAQKAAREHAAKLTPMNFALPQANPARKSSHFVVRMSNSEDDSVLLIVQGKGAAKWAKEYKQTAAGSSWEADGPDFAYTIVSDYPGLVKDLKLERYNLDQSEYSPPEGS